MRVTVRLLLIGLLVQASGCQTLGETQLSTGQVSVTMSPAVLADQAQTTVLRENHAVEYLHDFLLYYVSRSRSRIRSSISFETTVTQFRFSVGRDHMTTETVVKRGGQEIARFTDVETTTRGSQVERLSKALARRIVQRVRRY